MVSPPALLKVLLVATALAAYGVQAAPIPDASPSPSPLSSSSAPHTLSSTAVPRVLGATPHGVSLDANADLPLLPKRPERPRPTPAVRWEYVTVVTLLSAPFTALWYGLALGVVESVSQRHLPPKFTTPMYAGVGAAAGLTSLSIALVSVSWGGSAHALSPSASAANPEAYVQETP